MTMQTRVALFVICMFGIWLPVTSWTMNHYPEHATYVHSGMFLFFAVAQLIVFRCPHCGRNALFQRFFIYSPMVGEKCRHCGQEY